MSTYRIDRELLSKVNLGLVNPHQAGLMKAMWKLTKDDHNKLITDEEIIEYAKQNGLLETQSEDYRKSFATHKTRCFKKYKFMIQVAGTKRTKNSVVIDEYLSDDEDTE